MKHVIILCFISQVVFAQQEFPFLAKNFGEYLSAKENHEIIDVYKSGTSNRVIVKQNDRAKLSYPLDSVFVFRDKRGRLSRVYEGKVFKVLFTDSLTIYSRSKTLYKSRKREYFFSDGIGGDLHFLNEKKLSQVFCPKNCVFVENVKNEFKWHEYLWKRNRDGSFKLIEVYQRSLKN